MHYLIIRSNRLREISIQLVMVKIMHSQKQKLIQKASHDEYGTQALKNKNFISNTEMRDEFYLNQDVKKIQV